MLFWAGLLIIMKLSSGTIRLTKQYHKINKVALFNYLECLGLRSMQDPQHCLHIRFLNLIQKVVKPGHAFLPVVQLGTRTDVVSFTSHLLALSQHLPWHYSDIIMSTMASQITSVLIVYSTICSNADQRKHQSSASLAFVRRIHRWLVNSPHKGPVTWKIFCVYIFITCN